jgi:NTP pyrophosphatase (non-canonical NTP hydrolase)
MLYYKKTRAPILALDQYQRRARLADQNRSTGRSGLRIPLLGLFGEIGSLLSEAKRKQREKPTYESYNDAINEEAGDVLWYLSNLASRHRIPLSAVARARGDRNSLHVPKRGSSSLTFRDLQRRGRRIGRRGMRVFEEADIFALGGAVGRLMNEYADVADRGLNREKFIQHLAWTFHILVAAVHNARMNINLVAHNNLAKIESRWPRAKYYGDLLDRRFDSDEQIPRRIRMYFVERTKKKKTYVYQMCEGINIGDRLTDNKLEKDDYRFHDVFHLAYAAILGWSPVIRALFKVKRKSDPDVDENQDGARAILIEEGIATWIFNHGLDHKHFRYTKALDYSVLKVVRHFVSGYEVQDRPLWQWEAAILEGFKVFRKLKRNRRGWVVADLRRHTLSFSEKTPRR